jgi:hypothetical protein
MAGTRGQAESTSLITKQDRYMTPRSQLTYFAWFHTCSTRLGDGCEFQSTKRLLLIAIPMP